ncbi:predicted protein [Histoplasma capsulatum var. duboisii H88]|uniref:Predicted protein n=1 Tax=Ajellomyces capsulatus (strain H88) TaxID=544711 RepID=F0UUG3_AJEC8|nr:predicted protein [Histoplasma capsulatum var. duboisii H88]
MSAVLGGEPAHAGISSTYADEHTQYAWATEPKPKDVMLESSYTTYMYQGMRVWRMRIATRLNFLCALEILDIIALNFQQASDIVQNIQEARSLSLMIYQSCEKEKVSWLAISGEELRSGFCSRLEFTG